MHKTQKSKQSLFLAAMLLLSTACQSSGSGSQPTSSQCPAQTIRSLSIASSTKYIIKTRLARFATLQNILGHDKKLQSISDGYWSVDFGDVSKVEAGLKSLSAFIEYAEPDAKAYALDTPNDPMFTEQWAHQKIQSGLAWDITHGSNSVVVGVIDTGVDYTHPDIKENMWINTREVAGNRIDDDGNGYVDDYYGYDFANNDADPKSDDTGVFHGTHTAGTVGAKGYNSVGVTGHSPVVKIMALKFLSADGSGDVSNAVRAIDYAIKNGAKILNNSWGSEMSSRALSDAMIRARDAGILFVAASGNGGFDGIGDNNDTSPSYPANYQFENVISVASSNQNDMLSSFSNYGALKVQLAAPGEDILSTMNGGRYQTMSGTSMAAPLVSGVLALMIARRPDLNYLQIKQALLRNVDAIASMKGKVSSGGRINAYKALNSIASGVNPAPIPTPVPGSGSQGPASCN